MNDYAFLFPGQGSQVVGMGKDLYDHTDFGRRIFKMADEIVGDYLSRKCFEGPEEELQLTSNVQPAMLTVSYILYTLLEKTPGIAAGHSLGEYSALVSAGCLSFEDAVQLVFKRGTYMQAAVPVGKGAMAAVMGAEMEQIKAVVHSIEGVDIANHNGSTQVVISGEKEAVEKALSQIAAIKTKLLPVSAPFHSHLMAPAAKKLAVDLDRTEFKDLQFPVVNNIAAEEMSTGSEAREALKKQVTGAVLWHDTMLKFIKEKGIRTFIEVGSGKVLSSLAKRAAQECGVDAEIINIRNLEDIRAITLAN